jgi:hypothetical protein
MRAIRITPATGIAQLALVLAISGGAYAAGAGTSNTISACVHKHSGTLYVAGKCARHDKRLKWGVTGPAGAQGRQGATGSTGTQGPAGPFTATLPSGQTLRGAFTAIGNNAGGGERIGTEISFGIPLAAAPTAHFVSVGEAAPPECPGTAAKPAAAPGHLCMFETKHDNLKLTGFEDPVTGETGGTVQPFGAEVVGLSNGAGNYDESGSWAVTAP